jgi:hypothetical protein
MGYAECKKKRLGMVESGTDRIESIKSPLLPHSGAKAERDQFRHPHGAPHVAPIDPLLGYGPYHSYARRQLPLIQM